MGHWPMQHVAYAHPPACVASFLWLRNAVFYGEMGMFCNVELTILAMEGPLSLMEVFCNRL